MVFMLVFVEAIYTQSFLDSTKCSFSLFHLCKKNQMRSFETEYFRLAIITTMGTLYVQEGRVKIFRK